MYRLKINIMVYSCILCKHKIWNTNVSTHAFPKDPERRVLWLKAVNKSTVSKSAKLCSKHFDEKFYRFGIVKQRKFLLPTAVPTLYLYINENNTEASNLQLLEWPKQIKSFSNATLNMVYLNNEHEKIYDKTVLMHNIKSERQDELCHEEQIPQNNVRRMKSIEEGFALNKDLISENSSSGEIIKDAQNNIKRNLGHIGVNSKRVKYIGDVNWNIICHSPFEAKYYGMAAVKEIKILRKELNVRSQRIRDMNRKISSLQSLLAELKKKISLII